MSTTIGNPLSAVRANVSRPRRLHHAAWVTRDQEATRHFYEDVLGLPLVATWAERAPATGREYCHTFFALGDGGALAFFQYADQDEHPELPRQFSGAHALQYKQLEEATHGIRRTLPIVSRCSRAACALAASASGYSPQM